MKNELVERMYSGRYKIADEVESHIPNLDSALVEQAQRIKADLFPVSALELITSPEEARHFKQVVYPVEIAKQFFPNEDYRILEQFALDKTVKTENCGGFLQLKVTPRIIANRWINTAYTNVYSVVSEDSSKLTEMRRVWNLD